MRAIAVSCPQCGASLQVAADADVLTCQYCGTTAQIQRRTRVFQVPRPVMAPAGGDSQPIARQRLTWLAFLPLMIIVFVLGLGAFVAVRIKRSVERAIDVTGQRAGTSAANPKAKLSWAGEVPVAADVDGDGADDLIARIRYIQDGDRSHLAAFSGATGRRLWVGERLGTYSELVSALLAVRGDRVLLARDDGVLDAFDRATGARSWSLPLGEKVEVICAGDTADQVALETADEKWWAIDGAGGKRPTSARLRFDRPQGFGSGGELARFRTVGVEAAADLCQRLDNRTWNGPVGLLSLDVFSSLPSVPGMSVRRVVRRGGGPTVGVGYKTPGTSVPMLARLERDRPAWTIEIPASEPLSSRADDKQIGLSDRAVFAVYEIGSPSTVRLAGFALDDGHRLWDVALPGGRMSPSVDGVIVVGERVVVATTFALYAFDAADGTLTFQLGDG